MHLPKADILTCGRHLLMGSVIDLGSTVPVAAPALLPAA